MTVFIGHFVVHSLGAATIDITTVNFSYKNLFIKTF